MPMANFMPISPARQAMLHCCIPSKPTGACVSNCRKSKAVYDSICDVDPQARAREHREILDALLARDPERARIAMRSHFHRLISSMLDATEREALREVQERALQSRERFLAH